MRAGIPETDMDVRHDLTVVITNWNYGEYLADAISSIELSTVRPGRWYIVDDGSTDELSLTIYDSLPEENVIYQGVQQGTAAAYQRGLDECKTEWILYLDADDVLLPDFIEKMFRCAETNNVPLVYADWWFFDDKGLDDYRKIDEFNAEELMRRNFIATPSLVKTQLLRDAGGWRDCEQEDWDLWKRVCQLPDVVGMRCPDTAIRYRRHGQSRNFGGRGK